MYVAGGRRSIFVFNLTLWTYSKVAAADGSSNPPLRAPQGPLTISTSTVTVRRRSAFLSRQHYGATYMKIFLNRAIWWWIHTHTHTCKNIHWLLLLQFVIKILYTCTLYVIYTTLCARHYVIILYMKKKKKKKVSTIKNVTKIVL